MENNITFGTDKILFALNRVADLAKITLGASGKNVILETALPPYHIITNDGISIVNEASFDDPIENMGASMLKEVVNRANDQSGDGTTTAVVLAQAILKEAGDDRSMTLKRSLDECLPIIIDAIDAQKRDIETEEEVRSVATISSESEELGNIITEIYGKIGKDGIIDLDNSRNFENYYTIKDGITIPQATTTSPAFFNDDAETNATYENPKILITDQVIATEKDWKRIAETVEMRGDKSFVIICEGIEPAVNNKLAYLKATGKFNFLVIKAPTVLKDAFYEDISRAVGASLISKTSAFNLQTVGYEQLGTCAKIIVNRDETRFIGTQDVSEHIAKLKEQKMDAIMAERIKRLNTKVAILYLASFTATDLKYKKDKAEDAINATKLALQGGIVAGGGVALLNCIDSLPDTIGGKILKEAFKAPIRQIVENSGFSSDILEDKLGGNKGWDAKRFEVVDMFEAGIIDPASVTKNSVKAALSVASTVLTAGGSTTKPKQKMEGMMPFGMPGMM